MSVSLDLAVRSPVATRTAPLSPFGLLVRPEQAGAPVSAIGPGLLRARLAEHRLLVLRGFAPLDDGALCELAAGLGEIQRWEFGAINRLAPREDAPNYIYGRGAVPFHWDGAFAPRVPHLIVFHADAAPARDEGGRTLFCDTVALLRRARPEQRARWARAAVTYETQKVVHYGGRFTQRLLDHHPLTGEPTLRFAEPVRAANPVRLRIEGIPPSGHAALLEEMAGLLRDPAVCYRHRWRTGDLLIADNHALLHGRTAFAAGARRLIRRVNVL